MEIKVYDFIVNTVPSKDIPFITPIKDFHPVSYISFNGTTGEVRNASVHYNRLSFDSVQDRYCTSIYIKEKDT
jgi:hypothetical protein